MFETLQKLLDCIYALIRFAFYLLDFLVTRHDLPSVRMILPPPSAFSKNAGRVILIYVLDTGCDVTHPDLRGKVALLDLFHLGNDRCSHGTHVVGSIVSSRFGIAPEATVIMIKICNDGELFSARTVEKTLRWISNYHDM